MPGTGKTQVIIELLRVLVEDDKKVLLSSHTHSAIDNLLKRFEMKYPHLRSLILRLGGKTSGGFYSRNPCYMDNKQYKIVAVTCLGSKNATLSNTLIK